VILNSQCSLLLLDFKCHFPHLPQSYVIRELSCENLVYQYKRLLADYTFRYIKAAIKKSSLQDASFWLKFL